MQRTALIIGATGLVGHSLLQQLASLYDKVVIIARTQPKGMQTAMHFYQLKDFSQIAQCLSSLSLSDDVDAFSCLGTTLKQAGSETEFRQVDFDYNLAFAKACHAKGVQRFFLLSALGADSGSRLLYNRVKGELEQAVMALDFEQLAIFRPSLLLGKHEKRPMESLAQTAYKLVKPLVPKKLAIRPIEAQRVAMAMVLVANNWQISQNFASVTDRESGLPKVKIFSNRDMLQLTWLHK